MRRNQNQHAWNLSFFVKALAASALITALYYAYRNIRIYYMNNQHNNEFNAQCRAIFENCNYVVTRHPGESEYCSNFKGLVAIDNDESIVCKEEGLRKSIHLFKNFHLMYDGAADKCNLEGLNPYGIFAPNHADPRDPRQLRALVL